MSKGVLLFAFNNGKVDYYKMAIATAKRANQFLNLPVSVVTDSSTDLTQYDYHFDHIIIQNADKSNTKEREIWINKGRFAAYDISPYDETLLLDTDYLINSDTLLKPFDLYDDFMCHKNTSYLMIPEREQEEISQYSFNTLWATVMYFKKTERTKQIFECIRMVQENYSHYASLYNFVGGMYRNDYALTIALWIVNGHTENPQDYIPWNLVHLDKMVTAYKDSDTMYTLVREVNTRGKTKTEYSIIKDTDFHLLSKENFMELVGE